MEERKKKLADARKAKAKEKADAKAKAKQEAKEAKKKAKGGGGRKWTEEQVWTLAQSFFDGFL